MLGDESWALAVVALLAVAHIVPPMLTFVRLAPRSSMLSAAGGVSVAYVFMHLLPEVAEAQAAVEASSATDLAELEQHAYLAALVGLIVFYGLERVAVVSQRRRAVDGLAREQEPTSSAAFWLSVVSFAIYNAVIGYLVVRRAEEDPFVPLLLFGFAIALHFVVNDLGLRHRHRTRYDRFGRPLLVMALVAGWLLGVFVDLPEAAIGLVVAFLAGGIVLNVMKEELPQESESRFVPLGLGAGIYALILLLV